MKLILVVAFALFGVTAFGQVSTEACDAVKSATKLHEKEDADKTSYYTLDGPWFYDYSNNGKDYIKSRIQWEDDCTYALTLIETNIPNLGVPLGTMLRVQITAVEGNEVTYEYLPKGALPGGKMIIIE